MRRIGLLLILGLTAWHCAATTPVRSAAQRVVVIGFDGLDPTLARAWMDEGKLPNLKALAF